MTPRTWLKFISNSIRTMSQVSLPSKCCLGSYLKSARFCDGGKELPLEVKLTKLPGFSTFDPPFTLVDWFLDRFLGERLLGRAPKALGGGEDGRLIEAGEDDSVEGSVSKPESSARLLFSSNECSLSSRLIPTRGSPLLSLLGTRRGVEEYFGWPLKK